VAVGRGPLAGTGYRDVDRIGDLGVLGDGHDRRAVERRKRLGGNPVGGHTALTEPLVATAHVLDGDPGAFGDLDAGGAGRGRRAVVQAAQPAQRGEPPDLVAAVRHLEGVDVE
jgi:hypothetical protein